MCEVRKIVNSGHNNQKMMVGDEEVARGMETYGVNG